MARIAATSFGFAADSIANAKTDWIDKIGGWVDTAEKAVDTAKKVRATVLDIKSDPKQARSLVDDAQDFFKGANQTKSILIIAAIAIALTLFLVWRKS